MEKLEALYSDGQILNLLVDFSKINQIGVAGINALHYVKLAAGSGKALAGEIVLADVQGEVLDELKIIGFINTTKVTQSIPAKSAREF